MKKLLLLLLSIPVLGFSQSESSLLAFQKSIPAELGTPLHLPDPGYNPDFNLDKIAGYEAKQRVLVIVSDSLYKLIFNNYRFTADSLKASGLPADNWWYQQMVRHLADSLPVIDFSQKELVLYSACGQCLAYCHHDKGEPSCHRNVCEFQVAWFLRDKSAEVIHKVKLD